MAPPRRRTASKPKAEGPVDVVEPDAVPALLSPRPDARGDSVPVVWERQAVPAHIDVRRLDQLLDGLFGWPVDLADMYTTQAAIVQMWPDALVEVKHCDGREVHIVIWFGVVGFDRDAAILRVRRAP